MADERDTGPKISRSTDEENAAINAASPEPLRKAKVEEPDTSASREEERERLEAERVGRDADEEANPPRTTRGNFTAPKFGSAGSGGAEFEPGPERD
ncbi:MAG: hypothetical protein ACJ8AJ_14275 [Gemmatimonadaceae bacterium]